MVIGHDKNDRVKRSMDHEMKYVKPEGGQMLAREACIK